MHKEIKWGNKELPGLSHDELTKLTNKKLANIENGKRQGALNTKSGQVGEAGKIGGKATWEKHRDKFTEYAKQNGKACKESGRWNKVQKLGNEVAVSIKITCEHCGLECTKANYNRWHGDKCKYQNGIVRKKRGGPTAASIAAAATKITCVHCGKTVTKSGHTRWHGDNCKHKTG